jgi:hypothetical protein
VFAYRADIDGRYTLAVSLPGSDLGGAPREVDARPFPIGAGLVRLSARVRDEVGFTLPGDTAIVHLAAEGGPWLIALNAAEDPARAHHAALYVASLGHAMNAALGVETARLTWNIMQQFVDPSSVHEAAARAVRESAARLRAAGGFGVFGPDGSALLLVGRQQDVHPTAPAAMAGRTLRSLIPARPYTAVFEMRALDRVFTRRDIKLFEAAVANFSTWLTSAIGRIAADRERRGRLRSFDEIVDRYVQAAQASKDTASLVLLSSDDQTLSPQGAQALIRLLRPQLRPTDLAGRLTSGDVGILLLRTPGLAAQVVARRLAILLESAAHTLERRLRIGIASQNGDARSATALIENARVHARNTPL